METVIIVALIGLAGVIFGPLLTILVSEKITTRRETRNSEKEAREKSAEQAVSAQASALVAKDREITLIREDRAHMEKRMQARIDHLESLLYKQGGAQ